MSHTVDIHVGKKLKRMRILRNFTQTDVAQGLKISFQQVQKYEFGRNRVSASRLFELSHIFNVAPAFFFDGEGNAFSGRSWFGARHKRRNWNLGRPPRLKEMLKDDCYKTWSYF